ncbi:hypothetical protein A374_16869 [Fictibacillus macauensis ZFHKF-1]|uniref:Uncharacterized protein n=1 Tax=Fictibacillus macauensis ZFHKF-1 TaxID=1196324 RepID=I8AEV8_9BACL|nr:hypothetical protein [Fictibacillus macauensis]EIT84137.1 hypothetical protein A374_16869 [Fictibacillus macauensis ZFHKF-1]
MDSNYQANTPPMNKHQTEKSFRHTKAWGYVAAVALLPYALLKCIWAWGGSIGSTSNQSMHDFTMNVLQDQSSFLYILYSVGIDFTAVMAIIGSFIGIALVSSWGLRVRHMLLVVGWLTGLITFIALLSTILQLFGLIPKGTTDGLAIWVYVITYGGLLVWGVSVFMATLSLQKRLKQK